MKRRLSAILMALLLLLLLPLLSACGRAEDAATDVAYEEREVNGVEAPEINEDDSYYGVDFSYDTPSAPVSASGGVTGQPQKLIRTASLEMETTTFEETAAALADLTEQLGGYFANSSAGGSNSRWASYTIRIPVDHFQTFLEQAGQLCHETWRDVSQDDVSEQYYDTEGRLRTQNIKLQRLQALLEKAEKMEDIITIESAISETEQRIEELSGTLSHYDNLVEYATIELSLQEVYRFSNVPTVPESYGSRLGSAFVDGFRDFGEWVEDLTILLAYIWLRLLIFVLIGLAIGLFIRRRRASRKSGVTAGETGVSDAPYEPTEQQK